MNCPNCKKRPKQGHFNSKWCKLCARSFRINPRSTLSEAQIEQARKLIGKMSREDIAERVGTSVASLKRAFRGTRLAFFNRYMINPKLVEQVCRYYEKHGRQKTQKQFPDIKVRSIVERYKKFKPRQARWTDEQFVMLARMAGIVSPSKQAKFFNRPRANAGSIKAAWMKRLGFSPAQLHGMSHDNGKHLVSDSCPFVKVGKGKRPLRICLWVDMEQHQRDGLPDFISEAVTTLADFQRWLFKSEDPRTEIIKLMAWGRNGPTTKGSRKKDEQ